MMVRPARLPCAVTAVLLVLLVPGVPAEETELTASATTYGDRLRATTRLPFSSYSSRVHGKQPASAPAVAQVDEEDHEDNGLHTRQQEPQRVSSTLRPKVDRTALFRRQRPSTTTAAPAEEAESEEAVLQDARDLCRQSPNSYFCQSTTGRKRPQRVRGAASTTSTSTSTTTSTTTTTTTEAPTTRRPLPITMARRTRPKPAKQPTIIYTNLYLPSDAPAAPKPLQMDEVVVTAPSRKNVPAKREPAQRPYSGLSDTTSAPLQDEDDAMFLEDAAATEAPTTSRPAFTASRRPPTGATRTRDICDDPAHMFLCERNAAAAAQRVPTRRPVGSGSGLRAGGVSRVAVSDEYQEYPEHTQPLPTISSRSGPQHEAETFTELTGVDFTPVSEGEESPGFDVDPASEGYYFSRPALPASRPPSPEPGQHDAPFLLNLGPSKVPPAYAKPSGDAFSKPTWRVPAQDQSPSANEQAFKYQPLAFPSAAPATAYPQPNHEATYQPSAQPFPPQPSPQPVMAFALQPVEALLAAERQREEEHNNLAAHAILTALRMQADALRDQSATAAATADLSSVIPEATPAPRKQTKKNKKKNKRPKKPEHEVPEFMDDEDVLMEVVRPVHDHGHGHSYHGHRRPVEVLSEPPRGALVLMDSHGPHGPPRPPRPPMYRGHMRPARPVLTLHRFKRQDDGDGYIYPKPADGGRPGAGPDDEEGYDYPPPNQPFPSGPSSPPPAPGPSPPAPGPSSPAPGPSSPAPEPTPGPSPTPEAPEPEVPVTTSSVPVRPKPTPAPELKPTPGPGAPPSPPDAGGEEGYDYPPPSGQPFPAPGPKPGPADEDEAGGVELPGPGAPEEPAPGPSPSPTPAQAPTPAPTPAADGGEDEGYSYPRPQRGLGSRKA